jgi:hypothetical protein
MNPPNLQRSLSELVEWCRDQQLAALDHMKPNHRCDHPQCCPSNNQQWLMDAFAEEMELEALSR